MKVSQSVLINEISQRGLSIPARFIRSLSEYQLLPDPNLFSARAEYLEQSIFVVEQTYVMWILGHSVKQIAALPIWGKTNSLNEKRLAAVAPIIQRMAQQSEEVEKCMKRFQSTIQPFLQTINKKSYSNLGIDIEKAVEQALKSSGVKSVEKGSGQTPFDFICRTEKGTFFVEVKANFNPHRATKLFQGALNYSRIRNEKFLRLKDVRQAAGISQGQLAKRAGLSVSAISGIERDEFHPSFETLTKIAAALNVEPIQLGLILILNEKKEIVFCTN